jgi:hypothetical protein
MRIIFLSRTKQKSWQEKDKQNKYIIFSFIISTERTTGRVSVTIITCFSSARSERDNYGDLQSKSTVFLIQVLLQPHISSFAFLLHTQFFLIPVWGGLFFFFFALTALVYPFHETIGFKSFGLLDTKNQSFICWVLI